jgi:transposase-like protein
MAKRRQAAQVRQDQSFKGRRFAAEVILWAVRWYLMFPISYRDLELMLLDRGVEVDHTTIFRWIQAYAVELEKRIRPHLRMSNGSWRVDETYVKVKGRWMCLYRAVDSRGQTIDFLLSAKRDAEAAKRFFRKALAQPHTVNPRTITVDKNAAYPKAATQMKKDGELWRWSRLRQVKYLNNIVVAGPSERETTDLSRAWLWQLLDGSTNAGRLRSDGNDQEGAGSEHRWS